MPVGWLNAESGASLEIKGPVSDVTLCEIFHDMEHGRRSHGDASHFCNPGSPEPIRLEFCFDKPLWPAFCLSPAFEGINASGANSVPPHLSSSEVTSTLLSLFSHCKHIRAMVHMLHVDLKGWGCPPKPYPLLAYSSSFAHTGECGRVSLGE